VGLATSGRTIFEGAVLIAVVVAVLLVAGRASANGDRELVGAVDTATGEWHLRGPDGFTTSFYYGNPGDVPFLGDWDCDGDETPGLYRQSDGYVYLRNSNTQGVADIRFFFGNPGDVPLAGDFDGDGCDTVSIYRPSEARIYVINELGANNGGLGAAEYFYDFGNPGDKPFVADFDGDGTDTVGLHRESTGLVYYRNSNSTGIADAQFFFGDPGDRMIAGDWSGGGTDTVGLFRPGDSRVYLRYSNTQGNADEAFDYGIPRVVPVAGATGITASAVADRDWTVNTVPSQVEWGRFASVGFDANGRPIVSHGSQAAFNVYQLALTRCADAACHDTDTTVSAWRVSDHTSMTTGADWLPVWSFHDRARLIVARCTDTACATIAYSVVVPQQQPPYRSGILSSIAIGADTNPVIAYMSENTGYFVARCGDASCTSSTRVNIAPGGDFHRIDIATGSDSLPILSYLKSLSSLLAHHCGDAGCVAGTDATIGPISSTDVYTFPSVVIGTDGLPFVAYNDPTVALNAVHCEDVACESSSIETVEAGSTSDVSADLGGDGLPFIAFREGGALKVAHCDDLSCSSSMVATVDPGPGVGEFASLATDPYGMPVIAYYDGVGHDLKVARLGS
jgi:hypothetical protein